MKLLLGILVVFSSVVASVFHLKQSFASYYDFVGFIMVLGGTFAVCLMIVPLGGVSGIKNILRLSLISPLKHRAEVLRQSVSFVRLARVATRVPEVKAPGFGGVILRDGAELINLGFKVEQIESILKERIHHRKLAGFAVANSVKALAKYPPAFGLAGTVLGLVHLMRGISEGMDPSQTGSRMAIALVATFYGLLVANVFVNPVGEIIHKAVIDEVTLAEMALQAVVLAAERSEPLEAQELLNSFVEEKDRLGLSNLEAAA